MPNTQDELCPEYVGEQRITLNRTDPNETMRSRTAIFLDVDYSACDPEGVRLPLVMTICNELGSTFERQVFWRLAPAQVAFVPREGGEYLVRIGEFAHNRWFGSVTLNVLGDRLTTEA